MVFTHYEYFIAIVELGSLSKAAKHLYVAQPSLSQYLKKLEYTMGVELFNHSTSPLELTYAGERYYAYALQMRRLEESAKKELLDIENEISGKLRLGIAFWRGACLLPDIFPYFHTKFPHIKLELMEGRSQKMREALLQEKIDIAVMNLNSNMDMKDLTSTVIFEEKILLAVPTEHSLVQKMLTPPQSSHNLPQGTWELVKELPLLSTKAGQNLTTIIDFALQKNNIEPNVLLETANLTTAINLVARGMGCAFVPEEGATVCSHPGLVTYVEIDEPALIWSVAVVQRKNSYLNKLSAAFITTMQEVFQKQPVIMPNQPK